MGNKYLCVDATTPSMWVEKNIKVIEETCIVFTCYQECGRYWDHVAEAKGD